MEIEVSHHALRLLSLDGGGVKGLSAPMILEGIMMRVAKNPNSKGPCRPSDYFEVAAGTSTGGFIFIIVFRLRMTTGAAIEMYKQIAEQVFQPKAGRFDEADLKKAIEFVIERYGLNEEDKKIKGQAVLARNRVARMFLFTTAQNRAETALFRSYPHEVTYTSSKLNRILKDHSSEATNGLTVKWNGLVFWDGGLLNNNPINQLWSARYDLVGTDEPEPKVSCVLSLGCGHLKAGTPSKSRFSLSATVPSRPKGKDFSRHVSNLNRRPHYANTKYFRFNVDLGTQEIGLADYNKME
ncbi:calcium-independent phospholipase [Rhexocercosporidium sp. MPI-PUGE-AT-0058]|nr:calcium-independent phospholipase [Rhexocercosporidium sp. MPI-PUGE-AT-0058]